MQKLSLNTPEEMFALGQKLAGEYKILFLEGELGAGKTTLVKGFAAGLGIEPQRVSSPTYTYIQEYASLRDAVESEKLKVESDRDIQDSDLRQNDESKKLLHIDMYNIHSFDQLVEKGIAELVHDYEYIIIEWPKFIDELGLDGVSMSIEKLDNDGRCVVVND